AGTRSGVREATTWDGHYAEKRRAPSNNRINGAYPQLRLSQSSKVRLSFEVRVIHSARTVIDNETDDFFAKHQSSSLRVDSRSAAAGFGARGELSHHSSTSGGGIARRSFQSAATTRARNVPQTESAGAGQARSHHQARHPLCHFEQLSGDARIHAGPCLSPTASGRSLASRPS